jgi:hypothetical protein
MEKLSTQLKRHFILMFLLLSVVILFVTTTTNDAFATEGGGNAYPNGAEDFMSGAVPPPGTYFINYFLYYSADKFKGNNGYRGIPDFDLEVVANTFRFIHVTKNKILGGYWGVHMFVPIVYQDVSVGTPIGIISDTQTGLGDIIVDPFILSWHSKNWHFATGVDIYMPTGRYDVGDLANTSRNYWTFEPIVAFTYQSDFGLEVSSKFMYDFNTNNPDTDYRSGQEFHFDYTVGYKIDNWKLGAGGYYYKQITDDKENGETVKKIMHGLLPVDPGFKGQVFAVGPELKYDYKNMSFVLKYLFETAVENRPEGNDLWFKFVYAF